jgi:5-deoxy-D-glucuronate isomerase
MEFVKGMLRNAKMEFVEEGQVIAEQQQDIKYMVVLLEGKIGVEGTPEDTYAKGERTLSPLEQEAL